jgi:hypothetical protein
MSYTSTGGSWIDTEGLDVLFAADKPVSAWRARTLVNNLNHLRDVTTQTRISLVARDGETLPTHALSGDRWGIWAHFTTPWTMLGPKILATPVVRIGAHRSDTSTAEVAVGFYPVGQRFGSNPLAYLNATSFTATTPTVVVESEVAISWPDISGKGGPSTLGLTRTVEGADPLSKDEMTIAPSKIDVVMVQVVLFARDQGPNEDDDLVLDLFEVREYGGGAP